MEVSPVRWAAPADPAAALRLLWLPHAGGGSVEARALRPLLPASVELVPVVPPGRERRREEAPFTAIAPLVEALTDGLEPLLERPYAVLGYSMGALVALELVRALRRRGRPLPVRLLVAARRAPRLPDARPPIAGLPDADFVDAIQERYRAIPEVLLRERGLLALFLPTLRADYRALEGYRYQPDDPLPVPVTAYAGREDATAPAADLEGWAAETDAGFALQTVPGGHFFVREHREAFARRLAADLAPDLHGA